LLYPHARLATRELTTDVEKSSSVGLHLVMAGGVTDHEFQHARRDILGLAVVNATLPFERIGIGFPRGQYIVRVFVVVWV
jgi:hypothetical protein